MKEAALPIRLLSSLFSSSPNRAAEEIVKVITAPEFENTHGKFLYRGKEVEPAAFALDPENQRRLWEISEQLTDARDVLERGAKYDPTGSVAMFGNENIPEEIVRSEDDQNR
jgi:hypothetical protein